MRLWRRLRRILDQDRIRLPRRPLRPADLGIGDRLVIGSESWRVRGPLVDGGSRIELVAERAVVRRAQLEIEAPTAGGRRSRWVLVRGSDRIEVPDREITHFRVRTGDTGCTR